MCGIAGLIHPNPDVARTALAAMTAAQAHRGPDDEGTAVLPFGTGWLGLGHRRLSILDLSPLGHQPMSDPASGSSVVFNGEIYNFATLRAELEGEGVWFRGRSDTEVLLHALVRWGAAVLPRLEGMYAFAFHDRPGGRLLLARDPAGIKPVYMARVGPALLFASEVRAIRATGLVPDEVDRRGLAGLLAYGAVQHPFTLIRGVTSLPPGSCQEVTVRPDGGWVAAEPEVFWKFPPARADVDGPGAVTLVRETLDAAVRDHLVADVPVGVFLSAGLDSTVVAGLAARHSPRIQGFTVGFSDQPAFSETAAAAETAGRFGMRHVPIDLPASVAEAAAAEWLDRLDQPSVDGLNTYVISQAVRREGIKVALSGLGADELFGGYPSFRDVPRLARLRRRLGWLPAGARRGLAGALAVRRPRAARRKLAEMLTGRPALSALYFRRRRVLSDRELAALGVTPEPLGLTADFQAPGALDGLPDPADPVRAVSALEARFYQGNMLLRDTDANGMAHGLEIRVPFLDQRLLDRGHALAGPVRLPPGAPGKHLLRQAFPDLLRPELLARPKTGFTLPLRRWMAGPLRGLCEQGLRACADAAGLDPAGVRGVWEEFLAEPDGPQWTRALALVAAGRYLTTPRGRSP